MRLRAPIAAMSLCATAPATSASTAERAWAALKSLRTLDGPGRYYGFPARPVWVASQGVSPRTTLAPEVRKVRNKSFEREYFTYDVAPLYLHGNAKPLICPGFVRPEYITVIAVVNVGRKDVRAVVWLRLVIREVPHRPAESLAGHPDCFIITDGTEGVASDD